ncbi:MAG: alpha/beta hydrolase [Spirochaetia bacterium]|nr:alpha/beta hydrolase [Spirochaetia bacterium]
MNYLKFGNGSKTLVMIPGLSVQSVLLMGDAIKNAFRAYEKDYTAYLIDRREDVPPAYSVADMARDTAEKMKELGLKDVCLFGASQGGMIAMLIAAWYPELVHKLVLGSTTAKVSELSNGILSNWINLAKERKGVDLYLAFGEKIYPPNYFNQYSRLLAAAGKGVSDEEFDHFIIIAKGAEGFDATDQLDKIKCPVLVMGAEDDQVLGPEGSYYLARRLGCQLYMYNGYGHACYDTAPDYRERMAKFFIER